MDGELLNVLDHIEREKGIKREVLLQTVKTALISAAKKSLGIKTDDISVEIDNESGKIKLFSGKEEITSTEFGRIAAQTAKQVIIQKIREAERDVIFEDFQSRVGSLTNGIIHRFEKGNIVIDLGRTEAVLPRREQLPKEDYKQGDRVRAYILDVKKTPKGPQIILSRTHSGLLKKLFELEVPEIYEGIVEIKSISRESGERSKVAVSSRDEKIDCVGACVGMRGSRVKNIIKELRGEKIDIVRWSENMKDYITASLSPAEISDVKLNKDEKKAEVIVENDQLSLAIGKRGQNVRLACKLTGWDIDIRPKVSPLPKEEVEISVLKGVGPKTKNKLLEAGFKSIESILKAKKEDLVKIPGIGDKTADKVIEESKNILKEKK